MTTQKVIAKNSFHDTETTLRVKDGHVSADTARKLGKKLCVDDCTCGATKFFDERGRQMLADSDQDGSLHLTSVEPTDWLADA